MFKIKIQCPQFDSKFSFYFVKETECRTKSRDQVLTVTRSRWGGSGFIFGDSVEQATTATANVTLAGNIFSDNIYLDRVTVEEKEEDQCYQMLEWKEGKVFPKFAKKWPQQVFI